MSCGGQQFTSCQTAGSTNQKLSFFCRTGGQRTETGGKTVHQRLKFRHLSLQTLNSAVTDQRAPEVVLVALLHANMLMLASAAHRLLAGSTGQGRNQPTRLPATHTPCYWFPDRRNEGQEQLSVSISG